jgi:hypothetical protein
MIEAREGSCGQVDDRMRFSEDKWGLWSVVAQDITDAQESHAMLVVIDRTKKQMHAIPTMLETSALGLAKSYCDNVWRYHALPDSMILDCGSQFTAELMKELNKLLGIQTKLLMAYHPQMDSQMEQINQDIEQYLQLFILQ